MLWKNIKISEEDFLTGFLYALEYVMEILFFYGTGVVMYGFWQGITGGYLTLFAGMVISGAAIFHLLLEIFLKNRKKSEEAVGTDGLLEGLFFSLFAFRMNLKAGWTVLAGCLALLLIQNLMHGKWKRDVLVFCRYGFFLMSGYVVMNLFLKQSVTFGDSMALLAGTLFFNHEALRISPDQKEEYFSRKQILPVLCALIRKGTSLAALISLTPVFYTILNQTENIQIMRTYGPVLLFTMVSLVFNLMENHRKDTNTVLIQGVSLLLAVLIGSVILMLYSVMTGVVNLLCFLAVCACLFLAHAGNHDSSFTWNLIGYTGSHIALILVMILVFQIYDGIHVNYMTVLMAYLLNMAITVLVDEMRRENA